MMGDFPRALTAVSGLISLAIGLYVFMNGRDRIVNRLFFLMTFLLSLWAVAEAMTMSAGVLSDKILWTKFQGIGELLLVPTYLMIALYFPNVKSFMSAGRKTAGIIAAIYTPFILGLVLLFTTGFIYSAYYESDNISKIAVTRTPFFWFLEILSFTVVFTAMGVYLGQRSRAQSSAARKGLLVLALAPVPVL